MKIIQYRKIYYVFSALVLAFSIASLMFFQINFGIDFTGGSLLEVMFVKQDRAPHEAIRSALQPLLLKSLELKDAGEKNVILRFEQIDEATHQKMLDILNTSFQKVSTPEGKDQEDSAPSEVKNDGTEQADAVKKAQDVDNAPKQEEGDIEEVRFESIGPTIGKELREKTVYAIILVVLSIVFYIAWVFRKVSKPVASWKYGVVTILALVHDIVIPVGIFSLLGYYFGLEVNAPFVAALLTILGYSVNDTIVVFDRIRENLLKRGHEDFQSVVNDSINQTIVRSINTSLTTLLVLVAILFFGGATIRDFVLTLIIGIISGTYSSIFIASPLLVTWHHWSLKREKRGT